MSGSSHVAKDGKSVTIDTLAEKSKADGQGSQNNDSRHFA